jgi:molecular chaperone GrpE (heat shock protein)
MRQHLAWVAVLAIALPSLGGAQPRGEHPTKLYRWTDDKGVVHYGDSIPPEYAKQDRNVLNNQGVNVGFEQGELTPEQRATKERQAAEAAQAQAQREEAARRDKTLLATYISVSDIEDLRNRRLELLESQIKVTELYLANLRKRLLTLQDEASNYKPYTTRENAPQIPENLATDISRTVGSINLYEQTLSRTRSDQETVRNSFDSDIRRFKELKGG